MEVKPAPGTWQWPQGVTGWMLWDGTRPVAWFADKQEAEKRRAAMGVSDPTITDTCLHEILAAACDVVCQLEPSLAVQTQQVLCLQRKHEPAIVALLLRAGITVTKE